MIYFVDNFGKVDVCKNTAEITKCIEWQDFTDPENQAFDEEGFCYKWDSTKKNEIRTVFDYTIIKTTKKSPLLELVRNEYERNGKQDSFKVKLHTEIIEKIDNLISESTKRTGQKLLKKEEFELYRKEYINLCFVLIKTDIDKNITELAERALTLEIEKIDGKFNQFLYNFWNWYDAIAYQSPFLLKHTESDYYKKFVLWSKMKLEGINYNLKRRYN